MQTYLGGMQSEYILEIQLRLWPVSIMENRIMIEENGRVLIAGRVFLTRQALAEEIGVHEATVWRWHQRGEAPPRVKIGRALLYPEDRINDWLTSRETV
jgi:predicted DNA-binding transcriptional regulator AlpA